MKRIGNKMSLQTVDTLTRVNGTDGLDNLLVAASGDLIVDVLGRLKPGDGYGDHFVWDDTLVAQDFLDDPMQGIFVESQNNPTPRSGGWRRVLEDNFLTPYMFGGTPDEDADATDAVQDMINFAKKFDNVVGFEYSCSLAGRMWKVTKSIGATKITDPGFWIGDGGLAAFFDNSPTNGEIVLDLAGTNSPVLDNLKIYGARGNPPSVGIYYGRYQTSIGEVLIAPNAKLTNVRISGYFTKACIINFASETSSEVNCHYYNEFHNGISGAPSHTSYVAIYTDNMQTIDDKVGGLTSIRLDPLESLPLALNGSEVRHHSNILHHTSQCHYQRPSDVALTVTHISNATQAVMTFTGSTTALSIGGELYIHKLNGNDWEDLNHKCFTIADITANTVTINQDTTSFPAYTADETEGLIRNVTGSALLIAGAKSFHGRAGYILTYGASSIVFDCVNGSGIRQFDLNFQQEDNPDKPLKFELPNDTTLVQGFHVELLSNNQSFETSVFDLDFDDSTLQAGTLRFDNFFLRIANLGKVKSDEKIFPKIVPGDINNQHERVWLENAVVEVPKEKILNDLTDFRAFSGVTVALDTEQKYYISQDLDIAPIRALTKSDSSEDGPFVDVIRQNGNTTNTNQPIGGLRYIANDNSGNEQVYAFTRGRALSPTAGNLAGALDIGVANNNNISLAAQFTGLDPVDNDKTALLLRYNTDNNGQLYQRVTVGPENSGELGFRVLRVPNS